MPKKQPVPSFGTPSGGTARYASFKGLDYQGDETKIDRSRSPQAENIIADEGGFPERRFGWRTLHDFGACVSGIFPFENDNDPTHETVVVHAGTRLYKILLNEDSTVNGAPVVLLEGLAEGGRTQGFYMNGKLYLLTGNDYLVFDGTSAKHVVDDDAYIPLTSYLRKPAGGGEEQERVNMLCKYRKNRFVGDGTATVYQLDVTGIDASFQPVATYFLTGENIPVASFDAEKGTVTFAAAPAAPTNEGTSNVEIKFAKTTEDRKKILGCTILAIFGLDGASNRVFVSGNKDYAATEWFSGLSDPTYFPDINFSVVGSSDFPIMCYVKAQGELLVIKADNRQEGTIWHHEGAMVNNVAAFPLKEGVSGYGAVARYSAATLNDDPLYLSPRGVYAPTTTFSYNYVQRQLFCRSRRVNPKLCKEPHLEDAISAVWRGWYVLVIDGCAYVADGNQNLADKGYEWYYWTNIPAHVLKSHKQTLFFGTRDGRFCRFNDDFVTVENDVLMKAYNDDGAPIHAEWRTKLDTMDTPERLKTMPKSGSCIHLKAYTRSKVELYIRTEADHGKFVRDLYSDRLDFLDIDFNRFTFSTVNTSMIPIRVKRKKWKAIQIIIKSDAVNEGFGVHEVVVRYFFGNYAKR